MQGTGPADADSNVGTTEGRAAGLRDLVLATPHHLQRRLPKQIEILAAAAHVSPRQQSPVLLVHPPAIRKHDDSSTVRLLPMALVLLASAGIQLASSAA